MLWILDQIPEYVTYVLFVLGSVALVLTIVLNLTVTLRVITSFSCALLLTLAGWLTGAHGVSNVFKIELLEANNKVLKAEATAANVSAKTEYVYVDKIQKVRDTHVVIQEKIRDVEIKIDENCKISPELIEIHNRATVKP